MALGRTGGHRGDPQRRAQGALGVIFVRLRGAEQDRHPRPRDRHNRAPEGLRLADRLGEAGPDQITQVFGVGLGAQADRGELDEHGAHEPAFPPLARG